MQFLRVPKKGSPDEINLVLDPTESRAVRAALGEVCFGFRVDDFMTVIGCSEDRARRLFERLDRLDQQNTLNLDEGDLGIVRNAHRETLRALGVEEYKTRTGVEIDEGQSLLKKLDNILNR